jgi:hypothetical protein
MSIIKPTGLKGLPGLSRLSREERDAFYAKNASRLRKYEEDPEAYDYAAEVLYNNQQFKNKFNDDDLFHQLSYDQRNEYLTDAVVNDAFSSRFSPFNLNGKRDNSKGLGADYEKYAALPTEFKQKLLESDYLTPSEFEEQHKDDYGWLDTAAGTFNWITTFPTQVLRTAANAVGVSAIDDLWKNFSPQENVKVALKEGLKEYDRGSNNKILENLYGEAGESEASKLGDIVGQIYYDPSVVGSTDEETVKLFKQAITPNTKAGNLGIPEYASHYGIVDGEDISSEMEDFSIDDMRQVLAKKAVYERYMSPDMAMTVLNNEAKRYMHDHQGFLKHAALFANDVAIASTSYTVDKFNGFYNIGLMAADMLSDAPTVYIDDKGNVLPIDDERVTRDARGRAGYVGDDGTFHTVHVQQIDRTALHNMGKNVGVFDTAGSDDESILNPQDWTRKEQFGVWDKDLAKQYEKLGSSPYKVAYNPNDDRDILYESFKMMSFGLADAGAQMIPWGIGTAGKALSAANNVGRVVRGLGKGINTVSKFLVAGEGVPGKIGATVQGLSGALGIAEAYQRGAFQETLAQNMANLEESVAVKSTNEIRDLYNNDDTYRKQIDSLADAKFVQLKAERLASMGEDAQKQIVDKNKFNEVLKSQALESVIGEAIQQRINEHKASEEYADNQERAINSAGLAATNTFWPEAIKYGLVNTVGYRKYLFTNPTSVVQKASKNFEGLREVTTSAGRKRLISDASKELTNAEKWKRFGKVAGSQVWGGAWTNGTDDMMVDAAERINNDSFNQYLHSYETGEALADTYGFADGLYSYWMGLGNSLGQETTWDAATVGGLGSTISGNIHFTNLASLATKEGREAFKNNFQQRYKYDEDGLIERDENGKPVIEEVGWKENWRDRLGFFIQNGILNEYYGKKQNDRSMQEHANYINQLLDDNNDFDAIENLLASNIGRDNVINLGDEKTMRFVHAFNAVHTLERLGLNEKDPSTLSSVVNEHKNLIKRASKIGTDENDMSQEEMANLVAQYYSNNPGLEQSETNNEVALQNIATNARKLQEAYKAYVDANESISKLEKDFGRPILPSVRFKMQMSQALDSHWKDRLKTMKDEIGDTSSAEPTTGEALIAAIGGKGRANSILKAYDVQEAGILNSLSTAVSNSQDALEKYNESLSALRRAEDKGNSDEIFQAQKNLKEARDIYDESVATRLFQEDLLTASKEEKGRIQDAVDAWEKGTKSKVLSADEIMALDPVTRAKMMDRGNRDFYSDRQKKQIEKLEARLKMESKEGDPLQKIQDIRTLTQRIAQNEDAYSRLSSNPDAAAVQLEKQKKEAAKNAYKLINQRNAETLADYIGQMEAALLGRKDVSKKQKEDYVYRTLRNKSSKLLDIIDDNQMLPRYAKQVQMAKDWGRAVSDIDAVISESNESDEWKSNVSRNIGDIIENANSREEIISTLERVVDDTEGNGTTTSEDIEKVLTGLANLGYQREATVLEKREARRKRDQEARAKLEELNKKAEELKKKASEEEQVKMAEAQVKEWDEANSRQSHEVSPDGSNLRSAEEPLNDVSNAEQKGELEDLGIGEEHNVGEKENKSSEASVSKEEGSNNTNGHLIEDEDSVQGISATIDEQMSEETSQNNNVHVSDENVDYATTNGIGEHIIETSANSLSGNAMSEWEADPLKDEGRLVHKRGANPADSMNKYYAWMEAAGVKLQNIIDQELAEILKQTPHAKVKFMAVRAQNNATKDSVMKTHLMLVLDYDDKVNKNITKIHNNDNGGVFESAGKKYLVIGVVGYGNVNNTDKRALYDILYSNNPRSANGYGLVKKNIGKFWDAHPSERFYVPENLSTEIVPNSLIPGYIVKQLEHEDNTSYRSVTDILKDESRNPQGLEIQDLAWGIQEISKFLTVGTSLDNVMVPRNVESNSGRAFVLIPASNGKMVPSYLKPLFFNEMKDSELRNTVIEQLNKLVSPSYNSRIEAVKELSRLFYMSKEGDFILVGKDTGNKKNQVSLLRNGEVFRTFILGTDFNRQEFFDAIADMNPRINITKSVISSPTTLLKYAEAGALDTDAGLLHTAGSAYSIYALDSSGNMLIPETTKNDTPKSDENSGFKESRKIQVIYKQEFYNYDKGDGTYYLNGAVVTDDATIESLEFNRRVAEAGLEPAETDGVWDTYILGNKSNPDAVKINKNTKEVKRLTGKEVYDLIDKIEKEKADKTRDTAAEEQLEIKGLEDVGIGEESNTIEANLLTDEESEAASLETSKEKEKKEEAPADEIVSQKDTLHKSEAELQSGAKGATQSFTTLAKSKKYRKQVREVLKKKWPDAPSNMEALIKFLREKNIPVDAIGTSDTAVQAWIKTVEDCR